MKKSKVISITISVLGVVTISAIGIGANYLYNLALNPKVSKAAIFNPENNTSVNNLDQDETSGSVNEDDESWVLNHQSLDHLYLTSNDNLKLHNYLLTNKDSHKWAVVVHGYTSEAIKMSSYSKKFYELGYNIIMPDLRGHGQSEGHYIGMGWDERLDIIDVVNHIIDTDPDAEIVLFGVSMGAATVMNVSGEVLPSNVKAIIEDCGYTSSWDEFAYQLKNMYNLPSFPILHGASLISKIRAGYSFNEGSPLTQLPKSITPTLFIHGDSDGFVPFTMLEDLYNASPVEKEKLIIKGAQHAESHEVDPNLYWSTVSSFLSKYIS